MLIPYHFYFFSFLLRLVVSRNKVPQKKLPFYRRKKYAQQLHANISPSNDQKFNFCLRIRNEVLPNVSFQTLLSLKFFQRANNNLYSVKHSLNIHQRLFKKVMLRIIIIIRLFSITLKSSTNILLWERIFFVFFSRRRQLLLFFVLSINCFKITHCQENLLNTTYLHLLICFSSMPLRTQVRD